MSSLEGKKAVVTGGSRGIGAASAIALARAGAEVLVTWRSRREQAEAVVARIRDAGGTAHALSLDATDPLAVRDFGAEVGKRLGRVDVLFNNAGDLVKRLKIEEQTPEYIRQVFDLNVLSTILVTQALLPLMPRHGVIVNMSSAAGRDGGGPGAAVYAAAKGAILSLTRGWANEFAPRGIRVFAVAPGVVDTDFHKRHSSPQLLETVAQTTPAGKCGEPDDVARAVVYLAGEGNGFMDGVTIDLNGGRSFY